MYRATGESFPRTLSIRFSTRRLAGSALTDWFELLNQETLCTPVTLFVMPCDPLNDWRK
jgi:hypothetical protein